MLLKLLNETHYVGSVWRSSGNITKGKVKRHRSHWFTIIHQAKCWLFTCTWIFLMHLLMISLDITGSGMYAPMYLFYGTYQPQCTIIACFGVILPWWTATPMRIETVPFLFTIVAQRPITVLYLNIISPKSCLVSFSTCFHKRSIKIQVRKVRFR
jgi:hypothetical protein